MPELPELGTPCYLFDARAMERNLARVRKVRDACECRVLLALKGFAVWKLFSLLQQPGCLSGIAASSLHEARLGFEEFGKEVHVYAPAYRPDEFARIKKYASHVVFNSRQQWQTFGAKLSAHSCGIRVNPGKSEVRNPLYNPCRPKSHFGVAAKDAKFMMEDNNIDGLHFHALCEQNSDVLARTAELVRARFDRVLAQMRWVNFGGGHLIGDEEYDCDGLIRTVREFQSRYGVTVYLEPSGGLVHHCCELIASVLDVLPGGSAVLDCSASAHMPDVIETPYRPEIAGAGAAGEKAHTYRLCGCTCMAGDIFGEYSFAHPLKPGDRVRIVDAAAYTVVKHTAFNGVATPLIALRNRDGDIEVLRRPSYSDYRRRMA